MDLWAIARYDLQLPEDEFWSMAPRALFALMRRKDRERREQDMRFGILTATLANIHRDPNVRKDEFRPQDFFFSLQNGADASTAAPKAQEQTWQEQLSLAKAINAALGGRVNPRKQK